MNKGVVVVNYFILKLISEATDFAELAIETIQDFKPLNRKANIKLTIF